MKKILRFFLYLIAFLLLASFLLHIFGYGYIFKAVKTTYLTGHTTAFIDDHKYFTNTVINNGEKVQEWPLKSTYGQVEATSTLDSLNKELETAAFLIIYKDSLLFEKYYYGYDEYSKTNSFSMAKSLVTAMMFKAIQEGHLKGLDQPVADFFPQFDSRLKIGNLSSMSSGLDWNENYYNPFASTAQAYFGKDIREQVLGLKVIEEPGKEFKYLSGNTQLLAMVLEKATGKSLSTYLSENFWQPMGMNDEALWQLDSKESGMEKAYCCISSNARNFAKFGKLFLNNGKWENEQIVDSAYVSKLQKPVFEDSPQYSYGFWLSKHLGKDIFYMRGVLGQYVIMIPEDDVVIVRLGRELIGKEAGDEHYKDFYLYIEEAYKMLKNASETQS
ncbi:serine hydrolase domain-containing protein [Christiangramia aquimixticola]|uniref:serine hydrolase domain-containing protein n=1 Tax=Christiangramia aquimixticola TaxID=1697558 RepID=UPI003AA8D929